MLKKPQLIIGIIALLVIAGAALVGAFFFTRTSTTDTRSQAQNSTHPEFTIDSSSTSAGLQLFELSLDKGLATDDVITSFEATITLSSASAQQVLGITSERGKLEHLDAPRVTLRKKALPTPGLVPCYNTVIDGTTPMWPNSCRGITGKTGCAATQTALTEAELARYQTWKKYGKPEVPGCNGTTTVTASLAPQATVAPATDQTLYSKDGITVTTSVASLVSFETPKVEQRSNGDWVFTITGKITQPRNGETLAALRQKVTIVRLVTPSSPKLSASVTKGHIRGFSPVAPGTEIELLPQSASPSSETQKP